MYLQNTVSIHPISSYTGCDMVLKDELSRSNKILFLNKNLIDEDSMKGHQFKFWVFELREIKNSRYFLDSWTQINSAGSFSHIFFHQESFIQLLDSRIWSILLSCNSQYSTSNQYFTIMDVVLFLVEVLIYRINNRNMVEIKNIYLTGLLPIPMNSIESKNDTLEESFEFSNINTLILPLLYLPIGKKIYESSFMDPKESIRVPPINKKNWIVKKRDSSCKISNKIYNETITGIEISFKEKNIKYLEFLFVYYMDMDDPIRKDHDQELFDLLSPRKRRNIIKVSSNKKGLGQLFIQMCRLFMEREKEMNNHMLLEEIEEFLGNPTIVNRSFFCGRLSGLHMSSNPTQRFNRDQKLLKKEQDVSFVLSKRLKK
ncbi:hypothetical protein Lal_00031786 [Lupinus albus]|nr:hypothetical protein Lal_00031786 [Lupinus albus]